MFLRVCLRVKSCTPRAANALGSSQNRCHTEPLQVSSKCFCHVVFHAGLDLGSNLLPSVLH